MRPVRAPLRARRREARIRLALARTSLLGLLASSAAPALPAVPPDPPVDFPPQTVADGSVVAAHASLSGDPSDAAAARRRFEIVRSPYLQPQERRLLPGGDVEAHFDSATPAERRARLAVMVEETDRRLFDDEHWTRPFSARTPLALYLSARRFPGREGPSVAGWERRDRGGFVRPVVLVEVEGRTDDAVRLEVARQLALLSVRFSAPVAEAWAVEAVAEWAGRRTCGVVSPAATGADPLLAPAGSVVSATPLASLLSGMEPLVGPSDVREAWELSGAAGGGGEAFLRELASRAGLGPAELLADVLSRRSAAAASGGVALVRPPLPADGIVRGPDPLGWSWYDVLAPGSERDGVEFLVAPSPAARTARLLLAYRGGPGRDDAIPVVPGLPASVPISTGGMRLLVVDGGGERGPAGPPELRVAVRPLPGYPAAVEGLSARGVASGVEVSWRSLWHRDLLAWAVVRVPEPGSGTLPEALDLVPTTESSDEGISFLLLDRSPAAAGASYRIFALTTAGALADRGTVAPAPSRAAAPPG